MKLVNMTNINVNRIESTITLRKNGAIHLSRKLVESLKLKVGSEIAFYQDHDKPVDWYIKIEKGLVVRNANGDKNSFMLHSVATAKPILNILNMDKAKMLVATEPIEGGYYAIITKSAQKL